MSRRRVHHAKIKSIQWLPGDICLLRFQPDSVIHFEPGQFLSLRVPDRDDPENLLWRAYSLSVPPEMAKAEGYEFCIKKMPGGHAAAYLEKLAVGDTLTLRAAYGDFTLRTKAGRGVCMIGTGTGIAPLRSIALSREFAKADLLFGIAIVGFRSYAEVPFAGDFERVGLATTYAISAHATKLSFPFYNGRVMDVLKRLKPDFPWLETDYYLCGSGAMINDVIRYLKSAHGVKDSAIFAEAFEPASSNPSKAA
ncbi:MAG: hypothetical protein H7301_04280 [Cryobacterium sp.]|nr:hypothetical protein [Oligoflexia bacterium]